MAFNYMENISYNNNRPNFERDSVKTIAQLLAVNPADKGYDYGHIVFCEEDGKHYKFNYDYNNPPANDEKDAVTGWFIPSDGTRKALKNSDGNVLSKGYIILNRNRDFVSQIKEDETIYEIRDYFDLNGEEVTLPANCVLKFSGGMLDGGTVIGNGVTIEAPLVKIFDDDITLKGDFNCDFYPEWFGAVTYSEATAVDNAAVFNNAVDQIYNMNGAHDLILTGAYLIRDTIFLKPKVSLIGRYGRTRYDIDVGNKEIGSGFLVDFDDNNKYAIDSCLTQLNEKGTYGGKKQAIVNYNHLWLDAEATAEDSYTLSDKIVGSSSQGNVNADVDNIITKRLFTTGWKKSTNIKNITLQPLNKPTQSSEIPFGGIRLIGWYSGTIDSVTIQGFTICLNVAESWACYINRLNIKTYYIGVYLGKFCTQFDIRNSGIEKVSNDVVFNHKDATLVYRNKANLLLPYDDAGRVEGDEGFTYPITKYIATPESVDDDFLTNYANTQLLTVAIMTESYSYDQNKTLLDNIVFQSIDGILINTNTGNVSFNFCYIEGVAKLGFYTHSGVVRWLNPSFEGNRINPYAAVTFEGKITIEDMASPRCYPSYTMEDVKNGLIKPRYYVTPQVLYYDKFTVTPENSDTIIAQGVPLKGTVEPGSVAAAKQLVPINDTYYVGGNNYTDKHSWEDYDELATGLEPTDWTSFENIINHYNPKVATIYTVFTNSDFSLGGTLFKNVDYTFIKKDSNLVNNYFSLSQPMRLQDSKISIIGHSIQAINGLEHIFEVSGKCEIKCTGYMESSYISNKLIKLSAGEHNKPVELDISLTKGWIWAVFDTYFDNSDNVKYSIRMRTAHNTSYVTFTNKTPPTKGVIPGETFVYNGKTLTWSGTEWVAPASEVIPNFEVYKALGAEYNDTDSDITKSAPWGEEVVHKTGRWYYNGIGDLTDTDMVNIYLHKDLVTTKLSLYRGASRINSLKTIAPIEFGKSLSSIPVVSNCFFQTNSGVKVLRWGLLASDYGQDLITLDTTNRSCMLKMGADMTLAFAECYALKYVYPIDVSDTTNMTKAFLMGRDSPLIDVRLYGLKTNVSLKDCPNIRKECLLYIIANSNPTTAITITLHATAYANLAEDSEIVAKLEEKNTSLSASGGSISLESA